MTASYAVDAFNVGDAASILWFIHALNGEIGGLLGVGGNNATLSSGGITIFENGTITPQLIPEPSTLVLFTISSISLLGYGWRLRKRAALSHLKRDFRTFLNDL